MARKQRLEPVATLARHQQLQAERAVADAHRQVQAREQMLSQLRAYRAQYDQAEYRSEVGARSMVALRDYEQFLGRLDQAIAQQQHELTETRSAFAQVQRSLQAARMRAESLQLVLERARAIARQRDEAREQQLLDELATLASARR